MKTILLIDGHPLMYRAAFAHGETYVSKGIVRYFFESVEKFDCSDAMICWDAGKSRWRSQYYPDYKAQREDQKAMLDMQEIAEQRKVAQRYLSFVGVRNCTVYGVEADDLLAWFSEYFSRVLDYDRVIIVTRDKDLWQLVNDKVHVYDLMTDTLLDPVVVEQKFGIPPQKIVDYKALVGDTSDNIKGVKGIGDKTAIKFLDQFGGIEGLLDCDNEKELRKTKTASRVLDQSENLELSYQLVKLPSLSEGSSYLTYEEYLDLYKSVTEPVKADPMAAQIEAEIIGCTRTNQRAISSLDQEVVGILQYLQPKPAQDLSTLSLVDMSIKSCTECPLGSSSYGPKLPEGYENAKVMILGRNPIYKNLGDFVDLKWVVDDYLNMFLDKVGLPRDICWMTNACKCFSRGNRPPTYGEVMACSKYIKAEIELIKPKFIIAFGNEAMSLVTPYSSGVTKHSGEILAGPLGSLGYINSWVGIMVHPSAALRSTQAEANFEYGTKKIKEFLDLRRKQ
jgi:uracil-DNA glycosylase family 4